MHGVMNASDISFNLQFIKGSKLSQILNFWGVTNLPPLKGTPLQIWTIWPRSLGILP
jgi:hypothetical protein